MTVVPAFLLRLMVPDRPLGRVKLGPEDLVSIEFANRMRSYALQGRLKAVFWHTANELAGGTGRSAQIRYAIAKAIGLIPGTPDFVFVSASGAWALEAKAGRNSLTPNQRDFRDWCALHGVPFEVFRSADEGEAHLKAWGVLSDA